MIGVEHDDELAVGLPQGVVEIAGLRMRAIRSRNVANAQAFGKLPDFVSCAVVENIGRMRIIHIEASRQRSAKQRDVFIVRWRQIHRRCDQVVGRRRGGSTNRHT